MVMAATEKPEDTLSGTLERGLAILQHFATVGESTPGAVAEALSLSRSATYRLIDRLRAWGYLEANPATETLRLGMEAARLGMAALASVDVMRVAPGHLRALADGTGETVNLAVLDGRSVVYVYREDGPQTVKMSARLGSRRPVHCTGLGKAFLAWLPEDRRHALLDGVVLDRLTPNTITDPLELERELERTRARGYAVDDVEVEEGVACFAVPVRDFRGLPVAAISVAGPADRVLAREDRITPLLRDAAATISRRLGHA